MKKTVIENRENTHSYFHVLNVTDNYVLEIIIDIVALFKKIMFTQGWHSYIKVPHIQSKERSNLS